MAFAKKAEDSVVIPAPDFNIIEIPIRGTSILVVHKFSDKARKMMEDKQQGAAKMKRPPKVPQEEFEGALHRLPGTKDQYGFPAKGFKSAMVSACRHIDGFPMTKAKTAFHVLGDLVEIISPPPTMRTDMVRLESGVADVRYRPEFRDWRAVLRVRFLASTISASQVVNLVNLAGFTCGVGEDRPEKSGGSWGTFEVDVEAMNKEE